MWSLRNHGGYTLLMQFCSMTSPALSARCIYLLMFKKICSQISLCLRLDRYSSHQNKTKSYENVDTSASTLLRPKMEDEA